MNQFLLLHCSVCNLPQESVAIHSVSNRVLADRVRAAANDGHSVSFSPQVNEECRCSVVGAEAPKPAMRWAIGQFLYGTAVVGFLLTLFRNVFLAVEDWNMVNWPWNVYAWLLFDIPVPGIKHGPPAGADIFLFMVNMIIAALVGFYAVVWTVTAIKKGWKRFSPSSRELSVS